MAREIRLEAIAALNPYEIVSVKKGVVTIGREPENGIVVDSDLVSRRHSGIYESGSQWIYRDLGSTNGSWVNGIEVKAGLPRVLRDGDVIRVADFPVQVNYLESADDVLSPSILVFLSDKFVHEFPLSEGSVFSLGGPETVLPAEDFGALCVGEFRVSSSKVLFECLAEVDPKRALCLNAVPVAGLVDLSDRDVLTCGHYAFVVSLPSLEAKAAGMQYAARVRKETTEELASVLAYDSANLPEHLRSKKRDDGWESQAARRRSSSGKMFVFGTEPVASATFGETQSLDTQDIRSKLGYDMSPGQRFQGSFGARVVDDTRNKKIGKILSLVGAFVFFAIVAAVVYFVFLKK